MIGHDRFALLSGVLLAMLKARSLSSTYYYAVTANSGTAGCLIRVQKSAAGMTDCPTGKSPNRLSSPLRKNIPVFFSPKSPLHLSASRTHKRDVSRSSRTLGAGGDGRRRRQRRER
jgi:hypothetical protein